MTCGIYEIWIGNRFYQGRSTNIEARVKNHLKGLKAGTHANWRMQAVYDKVKTFEWQVLVECLPQDCERWETAYIETNHGDPHCMNILKSSRGGFEGIDLTACWERKRGKPRSEETKQKLREAAKKQMKDPEARQRLREAAKKQYADPEARQRHHDAMVKWHKERN